MKYSEFKNYLIAKLENIYSKEEINVIVKSLYNQICGIEGACLLLIKDEDIENEHLVELKNVVERLKKNEPLDYVIGYSEFYDLKFYVNKNVLIPRPETEELILNIENYFKSNGFTPENIIDIATGSGCIAITLKKIYPNSNVIATDISEDALGVSKINSKANSLSVDFYRHDMLLEKHLPIDVKFDIIASNPPYVLNEDKKFMKKNVLDYEPNLALFAKGDNPIDYYLSLRNYVLNYLNSGGYFIFEINEKMGEDIFGIFDEYRANFDFIEIKKDFFEKDRFVCGAMK